jgi:type II secretory pathway pseudopilin PulG
MRILRRLEGSGGQGLVEILAVIGLFGTVVAVGVPWYLGFQGRKADKDAQAKLVAAVPAAQAYRTDHGSYVGMDAVDLIHLDPRISFTLAVASARRGTFCLTYTERGKTWSLAGPYKRDPEFSPNASCA